jgi:hypothetical protein
MIRPLDASTWAAFAELAERNNGVYGATAELFEQNGFARVRQVGKHAWIVSKVIRPA